MSDLNYTLLMIGTFVVVCLGLRGVQWVLARATRGVRRGPADRCS